MKRVLFFMLVLLFVVPAGSAYSADITWAAIWADNRYYDSTGQRIYGMTGDTVLDTHDYDVYMWVWSWDEEIEYSKLDIIYNFDGPRAAKVFTSADGYPDPGNAYTNRDIYFFMDLNGNGIFDYSLDGSSETEPHWYRIYKEGTYTELPLVQNVSISYEGAQTIVRWDGITDDNFTFGGLDHYKVRVIDKETAEYYYDSGRIEIKEVLQQYEYVIEEDLLNLYGDNIWVTIEARDQTEQGLVNRSKYSASFPSVNAILEFFDQFVTDGTIEGKGAGWLAKLRLNLMREMLVIAGEFIERDMMKAACFTLQRAYLRCDSDPDTIPDFVVGEATEKLEEMIQALRTSRGCE